MCLRLLKKTVLKLLDRTVYDACVLLMLLKADMVVSHAVITGCLWSDVISSSHNSLINTLQ